MKHSEKENFVRVVRWDSPSHVCYPPPSRGGSYLGAWPGDTRPSPQTQQWRDIWGVTWTDKDGEAFPTGAAISSLAELDRLPRPDPHDQSRYERLKATTGEVDRSQYFIAVNHPYFLYENGFNILGPEQFLLSLLADPDGAHALLDILVDFELGVAQEYVKLKPDHVNLSDDYGMQDRLSVNHDTWCEFFKPRIKKMVDFYRSELGSDAVISLHSCGHVMPILEDLIEVGIDILNPIQSTANDLPQMRRVTSRRLVLCGGIDGQRVLPSGTPEDVRQEVRCKMEMLWEDGGYLPAAEKMLGVSEENRRAMVEAIREWSAANVEK